MNHINEDFKLSEMTWRFGKFQEFYDIYPWTYSIMVYDKHDRMIIKKTLIANNEDAEAYRALSEQVMDIAVKVVQEYKEISKQQKIERLLKAAQASVSDGPGWRSDEEKELKEAIKEYEN